MIDSFTQIPCNFTIWLGTVLIISLGETGVRIKQLETLEIILMFYLSHIRNSVSDVGYILHRVSKFRDYLIFSPRKEV